MHGGGSHPIFVPKTVCGSVGAHAAGGIAAAVRVPTEFDRADIGPLP
jgi:hypothetical protein